MNRAKLRFCVIAPLLVPCAISAADSGSGQFALEEVLVTAQKRVESLQDTPISITPLTRTP